MIIVTLGHSVGGATFESRFLVPLCTKHMVILATTVQTLPLLSVLSLLLSFFSPPPLHLYPETPRNGECDASVLLFLYLKSRRPQTAPLGERTVSPEWPRKDDGQQQAARRLQESLSGPTVGSGRGGHVFTDGRTCRRDQYNKWTGPRAYRPQALARSLPCRNDAHARPLWSQCQGPI